MATKGAHGLAASAVTALLTFARTTGSSGRSVVGIGGGPSGFVSDTEASVT
jgi:hypothetical protein